jgi:hypothetical protein
VLLLDAPGLLVHLIVRREAAPIVARRRGLRAGRRNRSVERPPLELATVSLGGALARQWGLLALRLRGRLPAYYSESAGVADG